MSRRNWLIRILQALVLVAVASSFAYAEDFMYFKKKAAAGGGGGGPDVYYYSGGNDGASVVTTDPHTSTYTGYEANYVVGGTIKVGAAGTITKISAKIANPDSCSIQLALWINGRASKHADCSLGVQTTSGWKDCTLASGYTVAANEVVDVIWVTNGAYDLYYGGTGVRWYELKANSYTNWGTYSSFPITGTDVPAGVRVYVD